jgi:hypothetical protein
MSDIPEGLQLGPTRVDAAPVLFAHTVSPQMCQQRQRDHYHKCFTCVHNNSQADARRTAVEVLTRLAQQQKVSQVG